jgi:hypothetical protein
VSRENPLYVRMEEGGFQPKFPRSSSHTATEPVKATVDNNHVKALKELITHRNASTFKFY